MTPTPCHTERRPRKVAFSVSCCAVQLFGVTLRERHRMKRILIFGFGLGFCMFLGCSKNVAPPSDSLEGWRYIFSAQPVQPDTVLIPANPYDTLTPQRIDQ